jgi:hypothetical protein
VGANAVALGVLLRAVCVICVLCLTSLPCSLHPCIFACPDCGLSCVGCAAGAAESISKACGVLVREDFRVMRLRCPAGRKDFETRVGRTMAKGDRFHSSCVTSRTLCNTGEELRHPARFTVRMNDLGGVSSIEPALNGRREARFDECATRQFSKKRSRTAPLEGTRVRHPALEDYERDYFLVSSR